MAQAWHKGKRRPVAPDTEAARWRATRYELRGVDGRVISDVESQVRSDIDGRAVGGVDGRVAIAAAAGARWERFPPFDSYQATGKARALESGPHLTFLWLKCVWERHRRSQFRLPDESLRQTEWFRRHMSRTGPVQEVLRQSELFRKALILFAEQYGLLGLFEEDFVGAPVLPDGKTLVAPEAVIDGQGRLRRVDPATEGKELLLAALEPAGHFSAGHVYPGHVRPLEEAERGSAYATMVLPSEISFAPRRPHLGGTGWSNEPRQLVPLEDIRRYFGALLILDERATAGVSVLCTREPLRRWEVGFRFFPSAAISGAVELDEDGYAFLNSYLEDVSPRMFISKDGSLERGWRHRSLLQAMHLMLLLDLTGGAAIKKCQSRGCPNYFRAGSQSKSKYCSRACANRASTRMGRGQEP